ncbi:MAG: hypothetical protein JW987_01080 [Anaerolineaceae bacterium]|nr:hypothetical protein [Anaerolineaceae bacterium]
MMQLQLSCGSEIIPLAGSGAARAWKIHQWGADTELEMALEGAQAEIGAWIGQVERLLLRAGRDAGDPAQTWTYLEASLDGAAWWRSPLDWGRVEPVSGPGVRAVGSQGIRLRIARRDWWEAREWTEAPLSNHHGTNLTGGILVDNHTDSGPHHNYADIAAGVVGGDLPAPTRLTLERTTTDGMEILAGLSHSTPTFEHWIETSAGMAGAGVTSTLQSDALASAGSYQRLAWSGAGAVTLLSFTRSAAWSSAAGSRIYRPVLRLHNLVAPSSERIWLSWRAAYNNGLGYEVLREGEAVRVETGQRWVVFPPLAVPPWPVGDLTASSEPVTLQLAAQAEGSGAHTLDADFAHFLPCEGWVRYRPVVTTVSGTSIVHDSGSGVIQRRASLMQSHEAEGPGIWLQPEVAQRLCLLARAGTGMVVDWQTLLKVEFKARKRSL